MGFYEVGIYLLIIVVASACVFGIMWLLMRSMQPKRSKSRKRAALATVAAGQVPKQLPPVSGEQDKGKKNTKNKKEKKKKGPKGEKLLELKDMPDNRLLAHGKVSSATQDKPQGMGESPNEEARETPAAGIDNSQEATAQEAPSDDAAQENGEMNLPDLPSLDTLTEEEEAPKEEEIDLMSVFESEEAEDSATSDLAANLFDVDVQNIEKLGSEVSEFLNGMRSK
ncbi:MAG: hypothetical protein JXA01_09330 [Dehalococcoidia bacterium]|nr:hypothetical protein [Dehalococcoidia bacterium]